MEKFCFYQSASIVCSIYTLGKSPKDFNIHVLDAPFIFPEAQFEGYRVTFYRSTELTQVSVERSRPMPPVIEILHLRRKETALV